MGVAIGVDVGGTKIAGGVVDEAGAIIARTRRDPVHRSSRDRAQHRLRRPGAAPRPRDRRRRDRFGRLRRRGPLDGPIRAQPRLAECSGPRSGVAATDLPVVVENDANAAAWEFRFGVAEDVDDMVCVTVGTGSAVGWSSTVRTGVRTA